MWGGAGRRLSIDWADEEEWKGVVAEELGGRVAMGK